jgi:hypothetical protein
MSAATVSPYPVHSQVHSHCAFSPRPRTVRDLEQAEAVTAPASPSLSLDTSCPRSLREPTVSRYLDWPER